jgi:hypothetical protein
MLDQYSREGPLPSDSPVSGHRTPTAHECPGAMVIRRYDGHLKFLTFLDVRPLELGEGVLSILGMGRGGI